MFEKLLNNEFKENNLKDIDANKIIINIYEKVESFILEYKNRKRIKKNSKDYERER